MNTAGTPPDDSERRYQDLLEFAPDAFFQGNTEGRFILVNSKAEDLTGYHRDELLTLSMEDLFSDAELNRRPLRYDLLQAGETVLSEREIIRKDGRRREIEMSSKMNADGTLQAFLRDVTERNRQRDLFREIEKRYETAFKTSPDAITITALDGTFVEVNDGYTELMGYTCDEVRGHTTLELKHWVDLEERRRIFEILDREGKVNNFEARFRRKDGRILSVLMSFRIIEIAGVPHRLGVSRDITKRKRMEEDLRIAKLRAEESDRLKSTFLANLSHEIRTPMNAILGFSELLREDEFDRATRREFNDIVHRNGQHLLSIINDIIEVSKIETDQIKPSLSTVSIDSFLHDLELQLTRAGTIAAKVSLRIERQDNRTLRTDATKLQQILHNLISNALKFTDEGEVRVWYERETSGVFCFHVEDTGIGISKENLRIVFDRFRRVEGDDAILRGGSGLGLAISKAYVEMLGGSITVESEVGRGSCFTFTIQDFADAGDAVETKAAPPVGSDSPIRAKGPVLVAEDDDLNYHFMVSLLGRWGLDAMRAMNGREAVRLCEQHPEIQLVLMDLRMPVLDGTAAMRKIRAVRPDLPVIAQTAYALLEEREKIKQAGFTGYLAKPIDRRLLHEMLLSNLG